MAASGLRESLTLKKEEEGACHSQLRRKRLRATQRSAHAHAVAAASAQR
jgi:hypothetical protein